MKESTIWITYHDDEQIARHGLQEDEVSRLYKENDMTLERYDEKAKRYFRYGDCRYQRRSIAFLAE